MLKGNNVETYIRYEVKRLDQVVERPSPWIITQAEYLKSIYLSFAIPIVF